jgi:hypothetical protein
MIAFWIILLVLFSFFVLFWIMLKGFKNPERKHEHTPADYRIDFKEVSVETSNGRKLYAWWMYKKRTFP